MDKIRDVEVGLRASVCHLSTYRQTLMPIGAWRKLHSDVVNIVLYLFWLFVMIGLSAAGLVNQG